MEFVDIINFAKENKTTFIATVEKDQPRVRGLGMLWADETGFYFQTAAEKNIYNQLKNNPKIELCIVHFDEKNGNTMLRIEGKAEFVDDLEIKKKVLESRKFLKGHGFTPESPGLIIFKVSKGQAYFWNMTTNWEYPKQKINFG